MQRAGCRHAFRAAALTLVAASAALAPSAARADYRWKPVDYRAVRLEGGFWGPRVRAAVDVTVPHNLRMCRETGRIANFERAAEKLRTGQKRGAFQGLYFNDSDVYKAVEAAAYALALRKDAALEREVGAIVAHIAAAQEPDGYLYTARTLAGPDYMPPGGPERWSDMGGGHELYCVGHLYEAAAAHFEATGKRTLLDVAVKNADLVCRVFGPGRNLYPCGHPEVELALVRLYQVTGDRKYLQQARWFVDQHGRTQGRRGFGEYAQDHQPILQQTTAVGHAVRAAYLYCAVTDMAALTGQGAYARTARALWEDVVGRKLYITGGIGARGGGEAFGEAYELPNRTAYAETCAAIAYGLWCRRMFALTGEGRYMDEFERVAYNGFLSGVSLKGDGFFYPNPLESARGGRRVPWFDCACCPPNVARFLTSFGGNVYATRGSDVYVNLYAAGTCTVRLPGRTVRLRQQTRYPWDGAVRITVGGDRPGRFALALRVPGWAAGKASPSGLYRFVGGPAQPVTLRVNGRVLKVTPTSGYARIDRTWKPGDTVALDLPMPVRRVAAHPRVADNAGRVALQRGPVVYCAEGADNPQGQVLSALMLDGAAFKPVHEPGLLGGVTRLRGEAARAVRGADAKPVRGDRFVLTAVPYYAWANRAPGQMAVWLPATLSASRPAPGPTLAYRSRVTTSPAVGAEALNDQQEPRNSIDHSNVFLHWWPRKGTAEWVQYEFPEPTTVSEVEVYWFDDTGIGECRLPASWRLLARVNGEWKPVSATGPYGVDKDVYNRVAFEPVRAEALRIEVQLPPNMSAGIHEWRVK